jgi:cytoskeletal protein RodZ
MACSIGQQLKEARLARGLSVEDIAHATKISVSALEAMEKDDFSVFSNATYQRSFLSLYARHLGLDVSEMLASIHSTKKGRRTRPDFLQTNLDLTPVEHTIPIVKHRIIERKAKRSPMGFALFLLLTLMLPAIFYAGKWVGIREGIAKVKPVETHPQASGHASNQAPLQQAHAPLRARVISLDPRYRRSEPETDLPDSKKNLLGLDAPPPSNQEPEP